MSKILEVKRTQHKSFLSRALSSSTLPLYVGAGMAAILFGIAATHFAPELVRGIQSTVTGKPNLVTFDPVKFLNAQRAAASILAVNPTADLALTMTQVAKQSEVVIREEARGALVIIKQALVLTGDVDDITDIVLERFGLPTNVPTVSTYIESEDVEVIAPTDSAFSLGKRREDMLEKMKEKGSRLENDYKTVTNQQDLIP